MARRSTNAFEVNAFELCHLFIRFTTEFNIVFTQVASVTKLFLSGLTFYVLRLLINMSVPRTLCTANLSLKLLHRMVATIRARTFRLCLLILKVYSILHRVETLSVSSQLRYHEENLPILH